MVKEKLYLITEKLHSIKPNFYKNQETLSYVMIMFVSSDFIEHILHTNTAWQSGSQSKPLNCLIHRINHLITSVVHLQANIYTNPVENGDNLHTLQLNLYSAEISYYKQSCSSILSPQSWGPMHGSI